MSAFRVLLSGALLLLAQQPPQQPVFRSATELVEVDVRVVDSDGGIVTTLTADDFALAEDGIPQSIDVVYLVTGGTAAVVPRVSPSAPADSVSRSPVPQSRQTWIFVFDVTHLSPAGLTRTRDAVRTFIKEKLREGDLGGIVGEGGMVNGRLTSNREELQRAAASVRIPAGRRELAHEMREWPRLRDELEALQIAAHDEEVLETAKLRGCLDDPTFCEVDPQRRGRVGGDPGVQLELMLMEKARNVAREITTATLRTVGTLSSLARGLARVPGPKTVLVLSEGFVTRQMEADVQAAAAQAAAAGARFYTVDARGLAKGGMAELIDAHWAASPVGGLGSGQDMHADGMNALAIETGGFAVRNENNFARALELIDRDSGTYYVLGYRPASAVYDGKYRRIDVRVKRPGVRVRARRGYLALEPARLLAPARSASRRGVDAAPSTADTTAAGADTAAGSNPRVINPGVLAVRRTAGVSDETVRRVLELAREAGAVHRPGNAAAGWAAYQRGDVAAAEMHLGAAVMAGDTRPWVNYALGFAKLARGRPTEAARIWERVRAAAPEFRDIYFDLADAYLQIDDVSSALAVLLAAEKRWPSNPEIYNALGVVQISRGALDDAVQTFEKAVTAAPDESLGHFNLGRAYSMRYFKSQRFSVSRSAWVGNTRDRDLAVAHLEKYVAMGGAYVAQAHDALAALAWR